MQGPLTESAPAGPLARPPRAEATVLRAQPAPAPAGAGLGAAVAALRRERDEALTRLAVARPAAQALREAQGD